MEGGKDRTQVSSVIQVSHDNRLSLVLLFHREEGGEGGEGGIEGTGVGAGGGIFR